MNLRAYGSLDRVDWVRQMLCRACGNSPCHNAHSVSGGAGRKAEYTTILPLCPGCHRLLHQMGVRSWQAKYGVDLIAEAADTQRRWIAHNNGTDPCAAGG